MITVIADIARDRKASPTEALASMNFRARSGSAV